MLNSYRMINPQGRFFQNTDNQYITSDNILDVGVREALSQINFSLEKFTKRGGIYS